MRQTVQWLIGQALESGCLAFNGFHQHPACVDFVIFSKFLQRRRWHPTPVLLPGKSHGCKSLVGCSPWGCEELDTTEQLHFHFSLSCIGEGNGNPLQCACLENPRDGGAWWAAIYGVTQNRTQLKWLSSSSKFLNLFEPPFPNLSSGNNSPSLIMVLQGLS